MAKRIRDECKNGEKNNLDLINSTEKFPNWENLDFFNREFEGIAFLCAYVYVCRTRDGPARGA